MKIYDKELYKTQEKMRTVFVVLIVFLIGFFLGYICKDITTTTENIMQTNTLTTTSCVIVKE